MFFTNPFRKYKKELESLYKKQNQLSEQLEEMIGEANCGGCKSYDSGTVKYHADRFKKCTDCENRDSICKLAQSLDEVLEEINNFIEGNYARSVFEFYSLKEPTLIRRATGEEVAWKQAFGDDFEMVTKSLRHSLVELIEGDGRYQLK